MVDRPPAGPGWVRARYWDLAGTDADAADDPDWTAGVRMAWNGERNLMVLEHMVHGRWSPATVQDRVVETARADGPDVIQWIEQDPGQAGKAQVQNYKTVLSGIARCEGNVPTGPKEVRAQAFEILVEQQRCAVVDGPWVRSFFDECESWGAGADDDALDRVSTGAEDGIHDDQIDACSGATQVLTITPPRKVRRLGVKA
jgi:predicted phage terminase large subunit-like protein